MSNLDLAVLWARGEHLRVSAERQAEDGVVHHHEVVLRLVLQIFPNLASREVPHLNEPIHTSRDQVLTIRRKLSTFWVRFASELKKTNRYHSSFTLPKKRKRRTDVSCHVTLICLLSCVGYLSSSCSRMAALPRNRSICVPEIDPVRER